jgi:hypothetical protein
VRVSVNGDISEIKLPVDQRTYFLILPFWDSPGFFRNESPHSGFSGLGHHVFHHVPRNIRETLWLNNEVLQIGPDNRRIGTTQFARAIAKIAFCAAVGAYGTGSFKPLAINDLILGKYSAIAYFVASSLKLPIPREDADIPHRVTLETGIWHNKIPFIVGHVRLFAHIGAFEYGMPIYKILIGIPSPELRHMLRQVQHGRGQR